MIKKQDGQDEDDDMTEDGTGSEAEADTETETESTLRAYRLTSGSHGRWEGSSHVRYKSGEPGRDVLMLTPDEAALMGDRVQLVEPGQYAPSVANVAVNYEGGSGQDDSGNDDSEALTGPPTGIGTQEGADTANDWSAVLGGMLAVDAARMVSELEDLGDVQAARQAEENSGRRKTVLDAADKRLKELS